jgi:hypothetical protein
MTKIAKNKYILIIFFTALFSWFGFYIVILKIDPEESTELGLGLFFSSLFVALTCTLTLIGYFLRIWFHKNEIFGNHINIALRQGILLSLCASLCLVFLLLNVLTWWIGFILVALITLLEFYFMSRTE